MRVYQRQCGYEGIRGSVAMRVYQRQCGYEGISEAVWL